jgi:hypothetical protein
MRLGGWQRVGIVISIIWMICAAIYQRHADIKHATNAANLTYQVCSESESFLKGERDCSKEFEKTWHLWLEGSWGNVAFVALVPVPLGWIIFCGLIGVSRWIRRGFDR